MKLSVALCTFNGEKHISEQLESILCQQMPVDEIIICDDGSSDKTLKFIADFQKSNPSIKLFENPENLGVIKNFEKAINLCSNGIVFLCDQDDIWFPDKTIKIVEYFKSNPRSKAVFHNLELHDKKPLQITIWDYVAFSGQMQPKNLFNHLLTVENLATGASFAFIKNEKIKLDDISKIALHDYQLAIHFSLANELGFINAVLGYYRIHDSQQIGADLKPNEYIKKLTDLFFNPGNNLQKVDYIVKKQIMWSEYDLNFIEKDKIMSRFNEIRQEFLRNHLYHLSFFHRKAILLYWFFKNKYRVNLYNVLHI